MTQQDCDLRVRQPEDGLWNPLLVGPLTVDSQIAEPGADSGKVPPISVSTQDELVPISTSRVSLYGCAEFVTCSIGNCGTVLLACCGVAERLVNQVAAVSDEMSEQREARFGPAVDGSRFRMGACQGDAITWSKMLKALPSRSREHPVLGCAAQRTS